MTSESVQTFRILLWLMAKVERRFGETGERLKACPPVERFGELPVVIAQHEFDREFCVRCVPIAKRAQRPFGHAGGGVPEIAQHDQSPNRESGEQSVEASQRALRFDERDRNTRGLKRRGFAKMQVRDEQRVAIRPIGRTLGQKRKLNPCEFDRQVAFNQSFGQPLSPA